MNRSCMPIATGQWGRGPRSAVLEPTGGADSPTHGVWYDHQFITTVGGLSPEDVTPIAGNYFSDHPAGSIPHNYRNRINVLF